MKTTTGTGELMLYTSMESILNKNISSYNASLKSKANFVEDSVRINHLYLKEDVFVKNIEDYRYETVSYETNLVLSSNEYLSEEERKKRYNNEEDEIFCGRFPHLNYCGCKFPCSITLDRIKPIEMTENIFIGPIESAYKTKELLSMKITHILNVSCTAFSRRTKYFTYLDIYISDNHTENAIKFFKITNRFIEDAIKKNQKILIHSVQGRSRCWVFLMAYYIGRCKMKYIAAYDLIREKFSYAEPNDNFLTQLKHYDLEMNT
jgi:hypothetical protein